VTDPTRRIAVYPPADDGDDAVPDRALGHAVERADGLALALVGLGPADAGVAGETAVEPALRAVLSLVRRVVCDELGGALGDVTALRVRVGEDATTGGDGEGDDDPTAAVARVCRTAFEPPHHPARSVTRGALDAPVSVDVEAFLPDGGWATEPVR
jgi:hypothetical protein